MKFRNLFAQIYLAACLLAACGLAAAFSADWRIDQNSQCLATGGFHPQTQTVPVDPISTTKGCGVLRPIKVTQFGTAAGPVALSQPMTLTCEMVRAMEQWLDKAMQPAATRILRSPVSGLSNGPGYVCRTRNSKKGAKISEHGFGNATDIMALHLANGERISIEKNWPASLKLTLKRSSRFIRDMRSGACEIFSTVLTPEGDAFHQDHMHFDLARHGRKGTYKLCK